MYLHIIILHSDLTTSDNKGDTQVLLLTLNFENHGDRPLLQKVKKEHLTVATLKNLKNYLSR